MPPLCAADSRCWSRAYTRALYSRSRASPGPTATPTLRGSVPRGRTPRGGGCAGRLPRPGRAARQAPLSSPASPLPTSANWPPAALHPRPPAYPPLSPAGYGIPDARRGSSAATAGKPRLQRRRTRSRPVTGSRCAASPHMLLAVPTPASTAFSEIYPPQGHDPMPPSSSRLTAAGEHFGGGEASRRSSTSWPLDAPHTRPVPRVPGEPFPPEGSIDPARDIHQWTSSWLCRPSPSSSAGIEPHRPQPAHAQIGGRRGSCSAPHLLTGHERASWRRDASAPCPHAGRAPLLGGASS